MERTLRRLLRSNAKAWYKLIDLEQCVRVFFGHPEAWIVDDAYLVIFDISTPWYAKDVTTLEEVIVLRLVRGGDFSQVPAFLERKAVETGATLVVTGTALAKTDAALVSMYNKLGYRTETVVLVKDINSGNTTQPN
jgi:hypothetical protein